LRWRLMTRASSADTARCVSPGWCSPR
jgi:hypothetical protein